MSITEDEFRLIFRELYPQMAYYALQLVDEDEMKDIVQEAFVELWKHRNSIADDSHLKAFLYRTVYNRALNSLKHQTIVKGHSGILEDIEARRMRFYSPDHNDVMQAIENQELHGQIETAIRRLPDKCRQAFVMSYLHEMKNKEIADVMEVSVRTVDAHIYKALKLLRNDLSYLKHK
ncbi:RNA polymerase sigma-70 factor [Prevotella sp. oral taxon 376]|uniref:RNA polymerase sigma-70 factor n=1 Tax=Prevotella sp. oral taxon 376 TaxID=712466 RepID=UPI000D1E190D|nr:RNA polymerase sigma-70 factor [Prevotella sp. oral taxon 376]PTL33204.1 RNA polymerase sigma-70 factor [Prevotella sp. oral taxon 376]